MRDTVAVSKRPCRASRCGDSTSRVCRRRSVFSHCDIGPTKPCFLCDSTGFGKSGATGFGCDDTRSPIDRLQPAVIRLPQDAPSDGEFAWLSYRGHWGQKEPFFNNGPTGPANKPRWDEPLAWVDDNGRESSATVPFARSGATDMFCSLSATGSALFNDLLDNPLRALAIVVVLLVGWRDVGHELARAKWGLLFVSLAILFAGNWARA